MNSRRPPFFKTIFRAASGGTAVIIALIALMFLRSPGTGSSDSDNIIPSEPTPMASTEPSSESVESGQTKDSDAGQEPDTTEAGGLTPDEDKALSGKTLGILIDDWDYYLEIPGEDGAQSTYRPEKLDRLVTLAKKTDGDSNGIRVRILQRESARPVAEQKLREQLGEAGINSDAIYMPAEFVQ